MAQSSTDYVQVYSQLINIGYGEIIAMKAAKKCKTLVEAIEWIDANKQKNNQYETQEDIYCDDKDVKNCKGLQKIISMLKFYNDNYNKPDEVTKYLEIYKHKLHLIHDYHHILDKHLNEETLSMTNVNKQFRKIYQIITKDNELTCNIEKCNINSRNNRQRELVKIDCNNREPRAFMDIMDTIHCYFLHSVDIGYRMIEDININDNDDEKETKDADDIEMKRIRNYLAAKRKILENTRGQGRLMKTKFMTHLTSLVHDTYIWL